MRALTEDQKRYMRYFREYGTLTLPMLMILEYNSPPSFGDPNIPEMGMYDGSPDSRRKKGAIYSRLKTLILRGLVNQVERSGYVGGPNSGYMVNFVAYEPRVIQTELDLDAPP